MSDHELFTTFVGAPPSRLLGVVRAMLELPAPVGRALWVMEAQGWGGTDADGDPFVTP